MDRFLGFRGQIDVIYTDFAKAFDKVPHQRLLAKLKSYVFAGVRQGGVLSPILFSIFIDSVICKLRASAHGASILVHTVWSHYDLYVLGQHGLLCEVEEIFIGVHNGYIGIYTAKLPCIAAKGTGQQGPPVTFIQRKVKS